MKTEITQKTKNNADSAVMLESVDCPRPKNDLFRMMIAYGFA